MAQFRDKPRDIKDSTRSNNRKKKSSDSNERRRKEAAKQTNSDAARRALQQAEVAKQATQRVASEDKRKTGVSVGTEFVATVANAFLPGAGKLLKPAIEGGLEWLSFQDTGISQEQAERQRAQKERAKDRNRYGDSAPTAAGVAPVDPILETPADAEQEVAKENTQTASREAKKRKKKAGTKTILTTPLGATETAKTAVTKLGGY